MVTAPAGRCHPTAPAPRSCALQLSHTGPEMLTSCHSFSIFSDFRLKSDAELKFLPWAVCRACRLPRCQHLPGRPRGAVSEGGSPKLAPGGCGGVPAARGLAVPPAFPLPAVPLPALPRPSLLHGAWGLHRDLPGPAWTQTPSCSGP